MNKCGIMLSEIAFSNMPVLLKNAGLDYLQRYIPHNHDGKALRLARYRAFAQQR